MANTTTIWDSPWDSVHKRYSAVCLLVGSCGDPVVGTDVTNQSAADPDSADFRTNPNP